MVLTALAIIPALFAGKAHAHGHTGQMPWLERQYDSYLMQALGHYYNPQTFFTDVRLELEPAAKGLYTPVHCGYDPAHPGQGLHALNFRIAGIRASISVHQDYLPADHAFMQRLAQATLKTVPGRGDRVEVSPIEFPPGIAAPVYTDPLPPLFADESVPRILAAILIVALFLILAFLQQARKQAT